VAAQDIGGDQLEVLVIDGCSSDGTAELARDLLRSSGFARSAVISNDLRSRPANLNRGLVEATGSIVCRVDARTRLSPRYVARCADLLMRRPEVAVVGGRQRAVCAGETSTAVGVARALNNRWGMGGARYRRAAIAQRADTVYLGAFRTDDLRAVGGWDDRLEVNEDFDLNRRLATLGLVWFDPTLEAGYLAEPSLPLLATKYFRYGRGKAHYWRVSGSRPRPRQIALAAGVPALVTATALASPTGRRRAAIAAVLGTALAEVAGADAPRGGLCAHAVAGAAMAVIGGAWTAGVWIELADWALAGNPTPRASPVTSPVPPATGRSRALERRA
jgi:GT2 family glycosyltransferase